ncbi:MAG: helix-turn-helix domain-containing protein [Lachnospiraceae bacterium]|nr:helix-turn-helix domain-containing protein [Lachnospiraceae bacterium]
MRYDAVLEFTKDLLRSFRLDIRYLKENMLPSDFSGTDTWFRRLLNRRFDNENVYPLLNTYCKPNTIYKICDFLLCNYLIFQLPDTADNTIVYAYIGPYTTNPATKPDILTLAEKYHITPDILSQIEQFYQDMPFIADDSIILNIVYTLGTRLWGSLDAFSMEKITEEQVDEYSAFEPVEPLQNNTDEPSLSMRLLEERYEIEHELMQAVSSGKVHKAEMIFSNFTTQQFEKRTPNPLRNTKNYLFVMNTILRLAAENGAVHPLHIDRISSNFAKKIELVTSENACYALIKEMIRKYCMLVKNHSLKGYSLLIRKVITQIDLDLTADLSLKAQSELLNVNSSYLSTLFKKETGLTLTEYVNRKRIEHAIFLLNTTNMQIQTAATYCGIPDVNYFTKIFKKMVGKTPKEYRDSIH